MIRHKLLLWKVQMIVWLILCVIFIGMITGLPGRSGEERVADTGFIIFSQIFFVMGMNIWHRLLKERGSASVLTEAAVISTGRTSRAGKRLFFPVYRFRVGETAYHVTSQTGHGICYVEEGEQVELYYSPENPRVFYVPVMHRHDRRVAVLLCAIGVVWPLLALFAPQIRMLISF